jgi:hypothetical protein
MKTKFYRGIPSGGGANGCISKKETESQAASQMAQRVALVGSSGSGGRCIIACSCCSCCLLLLLLFSF